MLLPNIAPEKLYVKYKKPIFMNIMNTNRFSLIPDISPKFSPKRNVHLNQSMNNRNHQLNPTINAARFYNDQIENQK